MPHTPRRFDSTRAGSHLASAAPRRRGPSPRWRASCPSARQALLYLNRTLAGDVYFLLASGRHLAEEGWVAQSPFRTLAEGRVWHNQQWLAEWASTGSTRPGGSRW
ncbi:MAG: hypothetical protein WKF31_13135 [Thermoleophilaceae bacterium]